MIGVDHLRNAELFIDVSVEDLKEAAESCREESYSQGSTIFSEGEEARDVFILREGPVTLRIHSPDRPDLMVSAAREIGEIFGWSALVEPRRFTATAVCLEDSRVIVVDGASLRDWLQDNPTRGFRVMRNLAGVVSARLRDTRLQLRNALATAVITQG
jgi:CRP-like cAMP-binding protein